MLFLYCAGTSGRMIAQELKLAHIIFSRHSNQYRSRSGRFGPLVNWGCTPSKLALLPYTKPHTILNADISKATSKRAAFSILSAAGINVPEVLLEWRPGLEGRWLARRDYLSGGAGIEVLEDGAEPTQPWHFIVRYIPKQYELRLHVFNGEIIHTQFKYIPAGSKLLIRNHASGGTFAAKPLEAHLSADTSALCRSMALQTINALGLTFGAVDMIVTKKAKPYVLEVNTAPGLSVESGTYPAYLQAFKTLFGEA